MTSDSMNRFEQEHLKRWWETTHYYLFADMESLPGAAAVAEDGWSPPQTDSHGGRKRFIARVRGRLLRSVKRGGERRPAAEGCRGFRPLPGRTGCSFEMKAGGKFLGMEKT